MARTLITYQRIVSGYISQQHLDLGWAWKIYLCEVKYILLRVLTKADCSGHIINSKQQKYWGAVSSLLMSCGSIYISLRLRDHLAEGNLMCRIKQKFQYFPHICLLLNFYRKKLDILKLCLKIDFWLSDGLPSFFSSIDFGCKNAKSTFPLRLSPIFLTY